MKTEPSWSVWREDDNGNRFLMRGGLSETQAREMASEFTRRGHKQRYWAEAEEES